MKLKVMLSAASLGAMVFAASLPTVVHAEEGKKQAQAETTFDGNSADALQQAYFQNGKNGFDSMSLLGQWLTISGGRAFPRGSYPEISIERDDRIIHAVYEDAMMQQTMNDPTVRVPDLPNPYNTSLMTLPALQTGRVIGSEFVYGRRPTP